MVGRSRHFWTPEPQEMDGDDIVMADGYDQRSFPQYANQNQAAPASQEQWAQPQQHSGNVWNGVWQGKQTTQRDNEDNDAEETAAAESRRQYAAEQSFAALRAWRDLEQNVQDSTSTFKAKVAKAAVEQKLKEAELAKQALQQQVTESDQQARAATENLERIAQQALDEQARFGAATMKQAQQKLQQSTETTDVQPQNGRQPLGNVEYSQLVLPRVIRLNFQKSKSAKDVWQFIHIYVDELDKLNPQYEFTFQQYEEIWAYCVKSCSRSGEFLLTVGLADNLNMAQAFIEDGARSILQTKALKRALKKNGKFPGELSQLGGIALKVPPKQHIESFNPPKGPKAHKSGSKAGNAPKPTVWNKEGTVVGHFAKELGADNKGRAMLEKMGWSPGMGLGTESKGILTPVPVVVKNSTLGLGMDPQQARRDDTWPKTQY